MSSFRAHLSSPSLRSSPAPPDPFHPPRPPIIPQERDELATKLRQELSISNDDHTRIREKLSEDERVKNMREGYRQRG